MHPAIFLDRDGVIVENRSSYILKWKDVSFIPGALDALKRIHNYPSRIVIVTNQSAVGRGLLSLSDALTINNRIIGNIQDSGGRIDGVYLCPHAPTEGCFCRKPEPGLIFQAAKELSIDLEKSILIGDALTDLQAAWAAGVPNAALARTGRGQAQSKLPEIDLSSDIPIFSDLSEALNMMLSTRA